MAEEEFEIEIPEIKDVEIKDNTINTNEKAVGKQKKGIRFRGDISSAFSGRKKKSLPRLPPPVIIKVEQPRAGKLGTTTLLQRKPILQSPFFNTPPKADEKPRKKIGFLGKGGFL